MPLWLAELAKEYMPSMSSHGSVLMGSLFYPVMNVKGLVISPDAMKWL
jgi:hypothetical protein